ncbi:MAG: magnesium/cobalt transporter CorA [Acidimicrobiaceae bacterium]|nr:magnesium/cobalt transporter CorA [Acidimicrobiaceae bacterium]
MTTAPATIVSPSVRHLIDASGAVLERVTRDEVVRRLDGEGFFWLDLPAVGDEEVAWMRDVFRFHPLAIDDVEQRNERPKLDDYGDYVFLVLYGSGTSGSQPADLLRLAEVHCFISEKYLVTVHEGDCPAFGELAARLKARRAPARSPSELVYRVADTLVDSFFPVLSELDDQIDVLQGQVIQRPTNEQLASLLDYRSSLIAMRRVVSPQRDIMASVASGVTQLPGFTDESQRYFRDIYDHLIRLSDMIDGYRDLLSGTTDAYLSVVSNQLNVVMKQLTIISTVFLPLAFITGFFGQNFGWMTSRLGSWEVFVLLGLLTELVAVGLMLLLFKRRGWLGSKT